MSQRHTVLWARRSPRKLNLGLLLLFNLSLPLVWLLPLPLLESVAVAQVSAEDRKAEADRLLQQGREQYQISQFREALQSWQSALEIYREMSVREAFPQESRDGEARVLNNIGIVNDLLGNYPIALNYYEQSLVIRREIGEAYGMSEALIVDEAQTLNNIGIVNQLLGNYPEALDFSQQSLVLQREIGDREAFSQESRTTEVATLNNIGEVNRLLGNYLEALNYYQQSLVISREIGEVYGTSASLRASESAIFGNIGIVNRLLGNYPEALDYYQPSLVISREIGDRATEANTLNNIGLVNDLLGNYPLALNYYQQSLVISQEIGDRAGEAQTLNNIGIVNESLGNYPLALDYYQQSLVISQEIGDRAGKALTLKNMGAVFEAQEQSELAIVFYKEAVNTYEQIRQSNQALEQSLQNFYTATIEDTYRHLADLLLQQDRILEAQRVLDLLKVQELDNYLRGVRSSDNARAGSELVPPERVIADANSALIDRAIANGQRLRALEEKADLSDAELDELVRLQAEQRQILQEFNTFQDSPLVQEQLALLSQEERDQNVQLGQLAALQDNLGQIPQGAVMLYPLILDDRLELIVTSPYAPPIRRTVNVTRLEINDAVQALRYALEEPSRDAKAPAQTLYNWLIAPIADDLQAAGVNTIIYAPDRSLRYIPLAALYDGEQWLVERYRINNITAASLTDLNTPPRTQPRILAGALTEATTVTVGDQSFNFRLLEHADDEINSIASLTADSTTLLGTDFNRARIELEANRYNIVHLATHAQFLVGQPEDSFILFSQQERWTLADFKAGLLSLTRVDLVVLSACETGVDNTFGNGEEILGFGYLMQTAGARASMASLWSVDDGGTQILMDEFYDALIRGNLSKAAALQQAQIALIHLGEGGDRGGFELAESIGLDPNDLSHPHYWAPFILIGNGL